jgi:methylated-DNA-[protein]-cysteine S-methyltransferase
MNPDPQKPTPAATTARTVCRQLVSPLGTLRLCGQGGVLHGLYMESHEPAPVFCGSEDDAAFPEVVEQLDAYFAGELTRFDARYELVGTPFQRTVWQALCEIPYGETISYGELARRIGTPSASRAVGLANGRNPVSIIVPCHRVIGANGTLTGYGGGIERKRFLLDLEHRSRGDRLF